MQILKQLVAVQRGGGGEHFPTAENMLIFDQDVLRYNFFRQVAGLNRHQG